MPAGRLLALLIVGCFAASAQSYVDLHGRVLDTSEGGISEASVTVVNEETGFRRATHSTPGGGYVVAALRPGAYKVTVSKAGFRTVVCFDVSVGSGRSARADFILPVGSIEETITVEGTAPLVGHDDAAVASRLDHADIERLPLNGRGLLTLLEFAPGTNVTPATRGEAGQFTTTGQRPNTNYFTIDGVSANTGVTAGGLPAQSTAGALPPLSAFGSMDSLISVEAVDELKVTTSTGTADLGRMPGATVALSSRSGSNALHGSAAYRIRNEAPNANDWVANAWGYGRLPLRLHDFTGSMGGPVKRNRTFFFLSYQAVSLRQPFVWLQPVPSAASRASAADWAQPLLRLFPEPAASQTGEPVANSVGLARRPAALQTGGARFDQAIGGRVSLFGRYNDSPSRNEFGSLAVNSLDLRSQSLTLALNARVTAATVLDARVNESQTTAHSLWSPGDDCALQPLAASFFSDPVSCDHVVRFWIGGVGQVVSGREGLRRQRQFQFVSSASWRRDRNTLTVGADRRAIVAIRRDPTGTLGVIADDVAGLADKRKLWISRADGQNGSADVIETSLWIQDTWQPFSRLTIASGLRWEYSPPPLSAKDTFFLDPATSSIFSETRPLWKPSLRYFAPRLGTAWQLSRSGGTVLRAGAGLYYDSSLSIATDILNGGPLSVSSLISSAHAPASSLLSYGFMRDLALPHVLQWNLSLEHAFSHNDVASIGYVGAASRRLIRREVGGAGSSVTAMFALTTNNGASDYDGLQAQYRRTLARGLQGMASYTWAHSLDNGSSDWFLLWAAKSADRGASDFDLRQSLTVSASYEPAWLKGWALDAVARARSGFPITVLQSEEYQGLSLMNAFRPNLVYGAPLWLSDPAAAAGKRLNPAAFSLPAAGVQGTLGRNVIPGLGMAQLDLAVRREFRFKEHLSLLLRIEAFNALNHPNFGDPARYLNSPVFGQSTSMLNMMLGTGSPGSGLAPILQTGGPRSLQGSLRLAF